MNYKHYIFASIMPLKLKMADLLFADPTANNSYIWEIADRSIFPAFPEVDADGDGVGFAFAVVPPSFMPKSLVEADVIVLEEKYKFMNDFEGAIDSQIIDQQRKAYLPYHQEKVREFCLQVDAKSCSPTKSVTDHTLYLVQTNLITL